MGASSSFITSMTYLRNERERWGESSGFQRVERGRAGENPLDFRVERWREIFWMQHIQLIFTPSSTDVTRPFKYSKE